MSLELTSLENAAAQLEEALDYHGSDIALRDGRLQRQLRAAVIQAFEFTYELSFKTKHRGSSSVRRTFFVRPNTS